MSNLDRYLEIKERVEKAQKKANKAQGALEQVMKQLKSEFGCSTLPQAKKKLKTLQKETNKAKEVAEAGVNKFAKKYPENEE